MPAVATSSSRGGLRGSAVPVAAAGRPASSEASARSLLRGPVEVDEFYVGGIEAGGGAARKSGSTKAIVLAAVELRGQGSGRLRLWVVQNLSNESLCGFVEEAVDPGAAIHTDAWQGYP